MDVAVGQVRVWAQCPDQLIVIDQQAAVPGKWFCENRGHYYGSTWSIRNDDWLRKETVLLPEPAKSFAA